ALKHDTAAIHVNTEEILARVMSLQNGSRTKATRTKEWVESIAVLSSYAESSYQDTIIDPSEEKYIVANNPGGDKKTSCGKDVVLDMIPEFGCLAVQASGPRAKSVADPLRRPVIHYGKFSFPL
ncbi:hypothetical protein IMZ48_37060, partial [Candidatus Bathyarchaeota archaeon]|nr:hypothetical protein [Candidatus Bathyarchaeota archaeon]